MNYIGLANLDQHVSAAIPLTGIAIFQVLGLELLYNTHMYLAEQEKRRVMQQVFGQLTKDCKKMEIWPPQKLTVLLIMYILLIPTSVLPAFILLVATQIISSIVIIKQKMKDDSENLGKHHDDDGIINDDTEENGLVHDDDFDGFHY